MSAFLQCRTRRHCFSISVKSAGLVGTKLVSNPHPLKHTRGSHNIGWGACPYCPYPDISSISIKCIYNIYLITFWVFCHLYFLDWKKQRVICSKILWDIVFNVFNILNKNVIYYLSIFCHLKTIHPQYYRLVNTAYRLDVSKSRDTPYSGPAFPLFSFFYWPKTLF